MYVCEYCKRHLKKKYDKCPACGSTSFKHVQNYEEMVIKTPPKDGYKVNIINLKHQKKEHRGGLLIGIFTIFVGLSVCLPFIFINNMMGISEDEPKEFKYFSFIFIIFGLFALFAVVKESMKFFKASNKIIIDSNKDINKVKKLSKNGILIKNLKYNIKPVEGKIQGNKTVYQIQVIYEIEKGRTRNFLSEPKYLTALGDEDGTVDLLVDPDDYDNYFVDFEIY